MLLAVWNRRKVKEDILQHGQNPLTAWAEPSYSMGRTLLQHGQNPLTAWAEPFPREWKKCIFTVVSDLST